MIRILLALLLLAAPGSLIPAEPTPAVPAATAQAWIQDAAVAAAAAQAQADKTAKTAPPPATGWGQVIGWGITGVAALAGLALRFAPAGSLIANVGTAALNLGWKTFAPGHVQDAEAKQAALASGMATVLHVVEGLPNTGTIGELKSRLSNRYGPEAQAVVNAWLQEQEQLARGTSGKAA